MKHRVKVTVLDTLLYEDLQQKYCQNPCSGKCPVYNKGDVFVFYREDGKDSFWQCGLNTLVSTTGDPKKIAGGPDKPFLDFSHYFRWLFANFRECSLIS